MPSCAATPPIEAVKGTALPDGALSGTVTLICSSPGKLFPGTAATVAAGWPPIITFTEFTGVANGETGAAMVDELAGDVKPNPVRYITIVDPFVAVLLPEFTE